MKIRYLTKASLIAGIYLVLILIQVPMGTLSFGPIQVRLVEGLTLLPLVEAAAVPGLFVVCLVAKFNTYSIFSFWFNRYYRWYSLVTLVAAYLTSKMSNKITPALPPIILNGTLILSIYKKSTKYTESEIR